MEEGAPSPGEAPQHGKPGAHAVVVRLLDLSQIELGSFDDERAALERARDFVRSASEGGEAGWPFAGNRFLHPGAIVSVDVIAGSLPKWSGSTARARWAQRTDPEGEPAAPGNEPATGPAGGEATSS